MPPPITQHSYDKKKSVAVEKVAKESMDEAITGSKATEASDMNIYVDGTRRERGFSYLNGVVAAVSVTTGKVGDVEVMLRNYKGCVSHAYLKTTSPVEYDTWKNIHDKKCQLNYMSGLHPTWKQLVRKI